MTGVLGEEEEAPRMQAHKGESSEDTEQAAIGNPRKGTSEETKAAHTLLSDFLHDH